MQNKLFTPDEIISPLKDYSEYRRRDYYLRNYYGMQEDYISIFGRADGDDRNISGMIFDRVSFAYYNNADFVRDHVALAEKLEAVKNEMQNSFEYQKSAFKYEMGNHEYHINWQADYDTLSAFGEIRYHGDKSDELEQYFKELHFTDVQRRAYLAARREYLSKVDY
jgi:hypothetical protein